MCPLVCFSLCPFVSGIFIFCIFKQKGYCRGSTYFYVLEFLFLTPHKFNLCGVNTYKFIMLDVVFDVFNVRCLAGVDDSVDPLDVVVMELHVFLG